MNWRSSGTSIWAPNCLAQLAVAVAQFLREDIGHGHQLDRAVLDAQRILRRAGAAPAASHQRQLNGVVLRRVHIRQGHSSQGGNPGYAAASVRNARRDVAFVVFSLISRLPHA